ncbi:MAG: hypothetical protein ACKVVT_01985 [Dehalococcoidia bacterium]
MTEPTAPGDDLVLQFLDGVATIFNGAASSPAEIVPLLRQLLSSRVAPVLRPGETPQAAAEERMARAWEDPAGPVLAVEALHLWPDCAEAYLYLAAAVEGQPGLSLALFTLAVEAASAALGPTYLDEYRGEMWERPEARTLMRAMEGMGRSYWSVGALEHAAEQFAELLALNPNDDQGVRYPLASCLIEMGNGEAVNDLLTMYDDGTAGRAYLLALAAFQADGDAAARPALASAVGLSPLIAEYLVGDRAFPQEALDLQVPPAVTEAMYFADVMAPAWGAVEGALDWLKRWAKPDVPRAAPPAKEKRSGPRILE